MFVLCKLKRGAITLFKFSSMFQPGAGEMHVCQLQPGRGAFILCAWSNPLCHSSPTAMDHSSITLGVCFVNIGAGKMHASLGGELYLMHDRNLLCHSLLTAAFTTLGLCFVMKEQGRCMPAWEGSLSYLVHDFNPLCHSSPTAAFTTLGLCFVIGRCMSAWEESFCLMHDVI